MAYNKTTKMYEGYIYLITNLINNKQYIGQTTTTIKHRFGQHYSKHKNAHHMPIAMAIEKYGKDNFEIIEIAKYDAKSKDELFEILNKNEIMFIQKYNTISPNGYNITAGGSNGVPTCSNPVDAYYVDGIYINSFESCIEAERFFNITLGIVSSCCYGKILKTKYKDTYLVFRFKGEPFDKYPTYRTRYGKKIYKFNTDGELLDVFNTKTEAIKSVAPHIVATSGLNVAIEGKGLFYGYFWSYENKFDFDYEHYLNKKPVDQYDFNGNKLNTFGSLKQACKSLNKDTGNSCAISECCNGKASQAFGFIWRYKDEPFDKYDIPVRYQKIKVNKYTKDDIYIQTCDSFLDALRSVGKYTKQGTNIRKCCDGRTKTAFGYKWYFANDPNQPDKTKIIA